MACLDPSHEVPRHRSARSARIGYAPSSWTVPGRSTAGCLMWRANHPTLFVSAAKIVAGSMQANHDILPPVYEGISGVLGLDAVVMSLEQQVLHICF